MAENPRALATAQQGGALAIDATQLNTMTLAQALAKSGWFKDVKDVGDAIVKMAYGQELGIGPIASMTGIQIVQGKPELSANLMAALIKKSRRYTYRIREHTNEICVIEFFERVGQSWDSLGSVQFTIQEARAAGLANKDVWKNYAQDMLFARAMSRGFRRFCAELAGGVPVYAAGEIPVAEAPSIVEHNGRHIDTTTGEIVEQPVTDSKPAEITCDGCGETITPMTGNGATWSPRKLAAYTRQNCGKALCADCGKKARAKAVPQDDPLWERVKRALDDAGELGVTLSAPFAWSTRDELTAWYDAACDAIEAAQQAEEVPA